jgi:hypothetical protein
MQVARGPRYGENHSKVPLMTQVTGPAAFIGSQQECRMHGSVGQVNHVGSSNTI